MKCNYLVMLFLSSVFTSVFAAEHNHHDDNEVRYIKKNIELDPQYQQQLRNSNLWQDFINQHPNWFVIFNENNQMPHRAFGAPISVTDLFSFLESNKFALPIDLRQKTSTKNDKYINKNFVQYYNNIEVINSNLHAKFNLQNELISFGLDIFNDININIIPSIDKQVAMQSATNNISNLITDMIINEDLKILSIPMHRSYQHRLVYVINFKTRIEQGPAYYLCYVDANSGELLMRKNSVMYEAPAITTNVSGNVYTTNPYNPASSESLKYLKASGQGSNYYTDINGDVDFGFLSSGTQIQYQLEGKYADVKTNGNTPSFGSTLGSTNTIVFDNSNSSIQERTAYHSVNMIHDHLKSVFPNFTALDIPMETNVDEQGSCNAFFNGSSINFYAEGNGCHATAKIPDVVYHEYGHAINGRRYNSGLGMSNGGLNEGYADIWAFSLINSPYIGLGWDLVDPTYSIRDYQDRKVYPQDLVGEVHADGEIIAGAFWDTYLNLNDMTQMLNLFKYTYDSGVDGPDGLEGSIYTDILIEVLFADDNDANLSNGTPNDVAIVSAFALHGITLLSNAVISHNPLNSASANVGVSINASVGITYPWALGSANCFYRINNASNWTNLAMTGTSSFTTTIPAQPNGTVIAYYISLTDNYGNESGITPMTANIFPINNANVPYFIMVGYELVALEDFDFNIGFWQTSDPLDNATTGLWEIGDPLGSYLSPGDPNSIVQTEDQHTLGGNSCAFTGNASSTSASIGENDVDGGHTTLYSPYYDMTDYIDPAFSYWRWFTNNSGAEPGADWWQVSITDDGVNWVSVENNLTSDNSWRRFVFRAKDYINLSSSLVQLRFVASDSAYGALSGGSLIEAAVDDLNLWDTDSQSNNIIDINVIGESSKLIKITDLLGREIDPLKIADRAMLLYIYDNGRVVRRIFTD